LEKKEAHRILTLLKDCVALLTTEKMRNDFYSMLEEIETAIFVHNEDNKDNIWIKKPRLYRGLGACPNLQLGIDNLKARLWPKEKKQEQALLHVQVKNEPLHHSMPSKDLALMTFSFILSRKLSSHTAAANLADSHYFKTHETGRWETFKHISIEVSKLILALSLPCGELIHTLGSHAVSGAVKGMEKILSLTKEGMECVEISSGLLGYIKPVDVLKNKFESKMRQLFGDSSLSQEEQLKQFASIFASIFPEDLEALQRFIHGLLWRYEEQIEKLSQTGAEQLALAIWVHLQHLFQLDFIEWETKGLGNQLEQYGAKRRDRMLDVMWYWVAKVHFLKGPVKLALFDGQFVEATELLHHGGYKCSNQNNSILKLDVREWQANAENKGFFETQGAKWGYRRTTEREFIINQFMLELSQYRKGIINETGLFTKKTLECYKDSPTTEVKPLPFSWKSQSEKIAFLEEKMKVLEESTVSQNEYERMKENLMEQIEATQIEIMQVKADAVTANNENNNLKEMFGSFVKLFMEAPGIERDEKIKQKAAEISRKLFSESKEPPVENKAPIETKAKTEEIFIRPFKEKKKIPEPKGTANETVTPKSVTQSEVIVYYPSPFSKESKSSMASSSSKTDESKLELDNQIKHNNM
jgi:hypothetical protein